MGHVTNGLRIVFFNLLGEDELESEVCGPELRLSAVDAECPLEESSCGLRIVAHLELPCRRLDPKPRRVWQQRERPAEDLREPVVRARALRIFDPLEPELFVALEASEGTAEDEVDALAHCNQRAVVLRALLGQTQTL